MYFDKSNSTFLVRKFTISLSRAGAFAIGATFKHGDIFSIKIMVIMFIFITKLLSEVILSVAKKLRDTLRIHTELYIVSVP